ncbi:Major facilitator superfamily domain, general substrate transporter [Phaffia rhodozyma]|uniref:Major facilitator superfamily domain, general substrate transporter n=1 Tax=Phaffia rhodozyma TaxID=264483 RepID=A0A0F7SSR4_PHARH|nr:Major facilitator superfamily domain, general substrate transporter [Phaffia rhodozyma]
MAGGAAGPMPASVNPFKTRLMPKEYYSAYALVTSLFFLWGFCYGLLDVLNKHFQDVLNISKLESTGLQVAYFGIGYFLFSPIAGEVLKRYGYKKCIIMGLCLYSLGAILFWPVAHFAGKSSNNAIFGGFVVCTGVVACGLATLEVCANSYVSCMPPAEPAAFRLLFSQSFNGVASFIGPFIASKYFFTGEHANSLTTVQFVYLAVAAMGAIIAVIFAIVRLPEVSEAELQEQAEVAVANMPEAQRNQLQKPFYKQIRPILGAVAQFAYVGAQVTIGTFFINYATDSADFSKPKASNFLSYALIIFTVFRFVFTGLLSIFSAPLLLAVCAILCTVFTVLTAVIHGTVGVICLMVIYAMMAIQYPVIFVLSTEGLGRHTRRAAALLVCGVSGGAVFPPIQGALAIKFGTRQSFWLPVPAFIYVVGFSLWIWKTKGCYILVANELNNQAKLRGEVRTERVSDYENDLSEKKIAEDEQVEVVDTVKY